MKHERISQFFLVLIATAFAVLVSSPAWAGTVIPSTTVVTEKDPNPNVPRKFHVVGAAGSCQPRGFADRNLLELDLNGFDLVNRSGVIAQAACSKDVYVSTSSGTEQVGLWVSNNNGGTVTQTVKCTMGYNTGGIGPRYSTAYVTVKPGSITQVGWQTDDFSVFGGQVTFVCDLKPKTGVMRVYTVEGAAS